MCQTLSSNLLEGIEKKLPLPEAGTSCGDLPESLSEAVEAAKKSEFVKENLSDIEFKQVFERFDKRISSFNDASNKEENEYNEYFYII